MKIFAPLFLIPFFTMAQFNLTVTVENVTSNDGKISVAVYNSSEGFLKFDKVFKAVSEPSKKGSTEVVLKNLPQG
ncbi:MAG TPA: DUF2141 domain-containing protein, partial [Pricia sp.]|nr:DUF2141 domain-containing protein [Pricia sp.]